MHDDAILTQESVHETRLAHVGLADHGHAELVDGVLPGLAGGRQDLEEPVEEVSAPLPAQGAHRDGLAETEAEEVDVRERVEGLVHLVHRQQHGEPRAPEEVGHVLVHGMDARASVHHEQQGVGVLDRRQDLPADLALHGLAGRVHEPARVDQHEVTTRPLGGGELPIPGDTRPFGDDRDPLAQDSIEKGRLAHVGTPHDGHRGASSCRERGTFLSRLGLHPLSSVDPECAPGPRAARARAFSHLRCRGLGPRRAHRTRLWLSLRRRVG